MRPQSTDPAPGRVHREVAPAGYHLVNRGHEVTVLAPSYRGLRPHEIDGVPVRRFRYAPKPWEMLTHEHGATNKLGNPFLQLLGIPYVVFGSLEAARLARRCQFDVIHSHWPFPHGAIAAVARWFGDAPVVANCHGAEFALARRKAWVRPLLRAALKGSDRIICNSSCTAADVKALSGCDAEVIPYGTTVGVKPSRRSDIRPEPKRILFTGRLIQRKGVECLIRAMPLILERQRVVLKITGDGDQRARLEALTAELGLGHVVEFLGFVDNATLDRYYLGCDVYVNPSVIDDRGDTEGLGVGPIEAFAHGKPVVASAVGGIPDVVKDRVTGLLVP
jgi:glycosyltransferase involved in cell wall biosynthesis